MTNPFIAESTEEGEKDRPPNDEFTLLESPAGCSRHEDKIPLGANTGLKSA